MTPVAIRLGAGLLGVVVLALVEARHDESTVMPLLPMRLFRTPAFSAGLLIIMVFYAGLLGLFFTFALWLQAGQHFSPLQAGLTAVAFSVGSFLTAGISVQLAPPARTNSPRGRRPSSSRRTYREPRRAARA